jgi:hypothetical protein
MWAIEPVEKLGFEVFSFGTIEVLLASRVDEKVESFPISF